MGRPIRTWYNTRQTGIHVISAALVRAVYSIARSKLSISACQTATFVQGEDTTYCILSNYSLFTSSQVWCFCASHSSNCRVLSTHFLFPHMMHTPTGLEEFSIASRREYQSPVGKTTLDRSYSAEGSSPPITSERHQLLSGALRRGKWTRPEEVFTAATIQYFLDGELELEYGTTLRGYLAQLLHCDPMRISKKLVPGTHLMGVRVDHKMGRRGYYPLPDSARDAPLRRAQAKAHLTELWDAFIWSIEQEALQEKWSQRSAVHVRENPLISRKRWRVPEGSARADKDSYVDWHDRPRAKLHKQRPSIHLDDRLSENLPSLERLVLADSQLDNRSQRRWTYSITSGSFSACVREASSLGPVPVPPTHPILPPLHVTLQRAINT